MNIICEECNKTFDKKDAEIKRTKHNFCSLSCSAIWKNKNSKRTEKQNNYIKKFCDNKKDEYSPFRFFARVSKRRRKYTLTLKYIKEIWEKQKGICPYTGVQLELPKNSDGYCKNNKPLYNASLDRIDSSLGYVEGNVQFTSSMANLAKNNFTHENMVEFCKAISLKWNSDDN